MDSQNLSPRRALLSVANKDGITTFARGLADRGFEIVSSGGTADAIAAESIPVTRVSEITGFPEILGGVSRRSTPSSMEEY